MALLRSVSMQSVILSVAAINSAPRTLAMSQDGAEVVDDDVALLQTSAIHNKTSVTHDVSQPELDFDLVGNIPEPLFDHSIDATFTVGSYISEDQLHCIQGPFEATELKHSVTRASPLSVLYNSHPFVGRDCQSRGYSVLLQEEDDCFGPTVSRWSRPGSPPERTNAGVPSGGLWAAALDNYDAHHHHPVGNARRFVSCFLCEEGSVMHNAQDCTNYNEEYVEGTRGPDLPNGYRSVVPTGDEVCFEGSTEYVERVLADIRTTPMGALFPDEPSTDDCQTRGFDRVRDMLDECWPGTRKFIRSRSEDVYMVNWIGRYTGTFQYDSSEVSSGLWSTVDWVSCSCDLGGAVRDRGMWQSFHGGDAIPYTDTYCNAMDFPDFSTLS
jgi:hypothetical protein